MGKNKYRFKGHESFILREGWLNKGLYEVYYDPKVFSENYGADALGVGPNMAKSIRYWLKSADLITDSPKTGAALTDIGNLIFKHDPCVEDYFTLWLIHSKIAKNRELATAWNLFFNEVSYEEFKKQQIYDEMEALVSDLDGDIHIAQSSVYADCDAILRMYLPAKETNPEEKNTSPFGKLGLLKHTEGIYYRKQPDLNKLPEDIIWFLLVDKDKKRTSVYLDDLWKEIDGPGKILQLKRTALIEMLERLEEKDKIVMNRTAGLNMIYWQKGLTGEKIVENYYER